MNEYVRGYAAATLEAARGAQHLDRIHDELVTFDRAVVHSEVLRRALTDPGILPATRQGIVVDLLDGKASPEVVAIARFAVRAEHPAELPALLAALVEIAAEAAGRTSEVAEPPAGRAPTRARIRGYAERVLEELGAAGEIDEVEDELFRFARVVDDNPALRRALLDPRLSFDQRHAILSELLAQRAHLATLRLVGYVIRAGRVRDLVGTLEWLVELAAEERGRRVAEVRSAVPLEPAERDRLAGALSRLVGRAVEVRVVIDPRVVGGVLVSVGDLVIDGTVRLRFERLRDLLAQQA